MNRIRRIAALCCAALVLAGCRAADGAGPSPAAPSIAGAAAAIDAFADDWQAGRTADASALTTDPAQAATMLAAAPRDLGATALSITVATPRPVAAADDGIGAAADVTAHVTWKIPAVGAWSYDVDWHWQRRGAAADAPWLLDFTPTVVHPQLGPGQSLAVRAVDATDGPIVDRNDAELITATDVYSVVVLVDAVVDARALAATLAKAVSPIDHTVTASAIEAGIAAARAAGQSSYTVTNLRETDYDTVRSTLAGLGAVTVPMSVRDLAPSPGFAQTVLRTALPVAERMRHGSPGWSIVTVDASGDDLATLAAKDAVPGPKVVLTLDPAVQNAAQAAVDAVTEPSVIVAIQPSTGEILAVAQNAAADAAGRIALTGQYPPGSIFKIVTATAAVDAGLVKPTTPVACPGAWTLDHRTIHNEGFSLGTVTALTAFAHSCNTTFAMLAEKMPPDALPAAAAEYGIGLDFDIAGITTLTGAVQVGTTALERAENGFGQGTDLLTPLSAALMAATAATGSMPTPVLIRGRRTTVDRPAPPRTKAAGDAVRAMMRAVVTDGTAKGLAKDGQVYAKTGTAEFVGSDGKIHAHAWTVGFRGDLAFSALIVGGNSSKRTNDLAHTLLAALPGR